jgi:hypothetical protein
MYTNNELSAVELSPTKKDYYQVWNELLDTAAKLSERWNPATTNESDPGVVLLKVLTAVADKLSYNIDANTLEAFMPSAAQETSMRKLCEMLGYSMRFYRSATTRVKITYKGDVFPNSQTNAIVIDKFSNIKNIDGTLNYVTLEEAILAPTQRSQIIQCVEGTLVTCETNLGTRVTFEHLDDNYRFYLPEHQIASNIIFVSNLDQGTSAQWTMVDNLNTCSLGNKVFKFGYDSTRGVPFLQFPEDVSSLIASGLQIQFLRTNGVQGNVSANSLKTLEAPASWSASAETTDEVVLVEEERAEVDTKEWSDVTLYSVTNLDAAIDGRNPETIDEAYWNFQKTIGTFDTLVTCRDYMNKIYQLTETEVGGNALVSNVIVSDIRDDINRAYSLNTLTNQGTATKHKIHKDSNNQDSISYFDLMLYPFVATTGLNTKEEYVNSFKYTNANVTKILAGLEEQKTIAHRIVSPNTDEIACIKAYFQLSARFTTTERVSSLEAIEISNTAHRALYSEFNLRNISFGETLPFNQILATLLNSHAKIKNVVLDEPKIYLAVCTVDGEKEYPITGDYIFTKLEDALKARQFYLDLTLKNALAGKLPLFNFDETFKSSFDLLPYPAGEEQTDSTASKCRLDETLVLLTSISGVSTALKPLGDIDDDTLCYANTEPGICSIGLDCNLFNNSELTFNHLFEAIDSLNISTFAPGAALPTHTLVYTPRFDASNTNMFQAFEALTPKTKYNFKFTPKFYITDSTSSITLCEIPFNIPFKTDSETTTQIDKVTIKLNLNHKKLPTELSGGAKLEQSATLKLSWLASAYKPKSDTFSKDAFPGTTGGALPESIEQVIRYIIFDPTTSNKDSFKATLIPPNGNRVIVRTYPLGAVPEMLPTSFDKENIEHVYESGTLYAKVTDEAGTEQKLVIGTLTQVEDDDVKVCKFRSVLGNEISTPITELDNLEIKNTVEDAENAVMIQTCSLGSVVTFKGVSEEPTQIICPFPLDALSRTYLIDTDGQAYSLECSPDQVNTSDYKEVIGYMCGSKPELPSLLKQIEGDLKLGFDVGNALTTLTSETIASQEDWVVTTSDIVDKPSTVSFAPFVAKDTEGYVTADIDPETGDVMMKSETGALPAISKIEGEFLVHTDRLTAEEPLVLKTNEVIQFRAPNFKTVATYPAYVNYYLKLSGSRTGNSKAAVPATMQTLTEFFDGGYTGYQETAAWNKTISWTEKIKSLLATDPTYSTALEPSPQTYRLTRGSSQSAEPAATSSSKFIQEVFTTAAEAIKDGSPEAVSAQNSLNRARKKFGMVLTKGVKLSYKTGLNGAEAVTDSETGEILYYLQKAQVQSESGYHPFIIPEATEGERFEIPSSITFYGLKLDASTMGAVAQWLQGTRGDESGQTRPFLRVDIASLKIAGATPPYLHEAAVTNPGIKLEKAIAGFYSKGFTKINKKPGYLVDDTGTSYELISTVPTEINFDDIYVPRLWPTSTASHTSDGLGSGAEVRGIPADTEYVLESDEYLLFTYSSSSGQSDGKAAVKNIAYGPGTIIKANFNLLSGTDQVTIAPYTKTSDFGPWTLPDKRIIASTEAGGSLAGMFTLGATEQIEIRERIKVDLEESGVCLYWELKSPYRDENGNEYLFAPGVDSYTLQAGEYLYYTDLAQEALAYYGSGSEIVRGVNTPTISRHYSKNKISPELINKLGLIAGIPWVTVNLIGAQTAITINEYQYVSLVEGDELYSIEFTDENASRKLTSAWQNVKAADYKSCDEEGSLTPFILNDCSWQVSSRLDLELSSSLPQILNVHQNSDGLEVARDIFKLYGIKNDGSGEAVEEVTQVYTPLVARDSSLAGDEVAADIMAKPEAVPVTQITFKLSDDNTANPSSVYYIPDLPTDTNWQEEFGKALTLGKQYVAQGYDPQNAEWQESTWSYPQFSIISHYYSNDEATGIFSTPSAGATIITVKDNATTADITIDLSGEYDYPRLLVPASIKDKLKDKVYLKFYAASVSKVDPVIASGKNPLPVTIYASTPILSSSGDISFLDTLGDATIDPVELKVGYQQPLKLSNDSPFTMQEHAVTPVDLGPDHPFSNKPVLSLAALVPPQEFGIMSVFVTQLTTSPIQIASDVPLAIFNNVDKDTPQVPESSLASTKYGWAWWSGLKADDLDQKGYNLYTLKPGLNTIVVSNSGTLKVFAEKETISSFALSHLKLVKTSNLFNPQLAYTTTGASFALSHEISTGSTTTMTVEDAHEALQALLSLKVSNQVVSEDSIIKAFNDLSNAKRAAASNSETSSNSDTSDRSEATICKKIAGVDYNSLFIDNNLALNRLRELDPDAECFYTDISLGSRGIELNAYDVSDTLLAAKNWFDRQNIANKFVVSEIDTTHLEEYVGVSKTSLL